MANSCSICGVTGACQSFAHMQEPGNWKSLLSGDRWLGPSGAFPYNVNCDSSNNWWKVAAADEWPAAWDLIQYNFGTRNPKEVNWYLYHFVGSRISNDGNKNLTFLNSNPGIIFTRHDLHARLRPAGPAGPTPAPPKVVTPEKPPEPLFKRSLSWCGVGVQFGGMAGFDGGTTVRAYMINSEDGNSRFFLDIDAERHGWGSGASGSLVYVAITGLHDPYDVRFAPQNSLDFQLAFGGRWGSYAKGLKMIPNLQRLVQAARASTHIRDAKTLAALANQVKGVLKRAGVDDASNDLEVTLVELPVGTGLEGSVYWEKARFRAHDVIVTPEPGDLD